VLAATALFALFRTIIEQASSMMVAPIAVGFAFG
jgi:hypothetical protein